MSAIETFRQDLQDRIAKLDADPGVALLIGLISPGADEAQIAAAEEVLGYPLPEPLKSLYRVADGVQIAWCRPDNPYCRREPPSEWSGVEGAFEMMEDLGGALLIPSLAEACVLLDGLFDSLLESLESLGATRALPFDLFHYYTYAAVVWNDDADLHVVVCDDEGASWEDHAPIPFAEYLQLVLDADLAVEARTERSESASETMPAPSKPALQRNTVFVYDIEGWPRARHLADLFDLPAGYRTMGFYAHHPEGPAVTCWKEIPEPACDPAETKRGLDLSHQLTLSLVRDLRVQEVVGRRLAGGFHAGATAAELAACFRADGYEVLSREGLTRTKASQATWLDEIKNAKLLRYLREGGPRPTGLKSPGWGNVLPSAVASWGPPEERLFAVLMHSPLAGRVIADLDWHLEGTDWWVSRLSEVSELDEGAWLRCLAAEPGFPGSRAWALCATPMEVLVEAFGEDSKTPHRWSALVSSWVSLRRPDKAVELLVDPRVRLEDWAISKIVAAPGGPECIEAARVELGTHATHVRLTVAALKEFDRSGHAKLIRYLFAKMKGPPTGARSVVRRFEFYHPAGGKFWEIVVDGAQVFTRWGKIDASGQGMDKAFATPEAAAKVAEKQILAKVRKGYVEVD